MLRWWGFDSVVMVLLWCCDGAVTISVDGMRLVLDAEHWLHMTAMSLLMPAMPHVHRRPHQERFQLGPVLLRFRASHRRATACKGWRSIGGLAEQPLAHASIHNSCLASTDCCDVVTELCSVRGRCCVVTVFNCCCVVSCFENVNVNATVRNHSHWDNHTASPQFPQQTARCNTRHRGPVSIRSSQSMSAGTQQRNNHE